MNPVEIGLSFVEGLALIASPCILPVLPLVLSASVEGGKKRPFGIIAGFVLSFTLFAMLSRKLVMAFDIDLDLIKYGSLILLAAFGLVLLSEHLSGKFAALTQRFANAGTTLTQNAKEGFGSGVIIGLLIGLVWTPCAGPILATVLVQVIRQESDLAGFLIIGSFALGAGVPMLLIALSGRKLINKLSFFTTHAGAVRKGFGVLILLSVAFIASGIDVQSLFSKQDNTIITTTGLHDALPAPYPAPEFAGIEAWLNSKPLTMQSLKGKVVLIDFWTYSCINCVRTLPYVTQWDQKYRDKGLVIIGVHAPEFEFEKSRANVEAALLRHNIQYPVALDNKLDTWTHFKNRYWPAHYLINQQGQVVYTHFGEGKYNVTEHNIRTLLGLKGEMQTAPTPTAPTAKLTPETYLGFARSKNFGGEENVKTATSSNFHFPPSLSEDHWALSGTWSIEPQRIVSTEANAGLQLHFNARKVFLVLGSKNNTPIHVTIKLNGQSATPLTITHHTLYELIDQQTHKPGQLEITADSPGLEAYAFTFGR